MKPSLLSVYPGLYFPRYAAYGFGVPTTIVLFALSIDTSGFIPSLTVGYGKVKKHQMSMRLIILNFVSKTVKGTCWMSDSLASFIFYFLPMLFVSCSNVILYILTVASINHIASITNSGHLLSLLNLIQTIG